MCCLWKNGILENIVTILCEDLVKIVAVMAPSIGVNLRVTGHCNQGGRKYMEDAFAVAYQQTDDERDLEYAYFGIFDGHGGREAALFAKEHLMNFIVSHKNFWSDQDENVLKAIKDGFVATHMAMWKQVGNWPQTVSGLPSTSGTTASVVFIRKGKMYVGHVGDSAIVLGYREPELSSTFVDCKHYSSQSLTRDHKPETPAERRRIENVGGSVISKCGVQRVVWNRPRIGHKGPIRRSTHIDQIPFLAVARSLGDLWSYDYYYGQFIVSPEPDVSVVTIDPKRDRCIILATDGVWNMLSSREAVRIVEAAEQENERHFLNDETRQIGCKPWVNPSRLLVDRALSLWGLRNKRADNTSVVTVMLDPPGPPRSEVLLRKRMLQKLRPRDEMESGLAVDNDWCEPRSRVMVCQAPAEPYIPSLPDGTILFPVSRRSESQTSTIPHLPRLPQKTKPSANFGVGIHKPGVSYGTEAQSSKMASSCYVPAASSSFQRPSLHPATHVEDSGLGQEMVRSARTPPPQTPDESPASHPPHTRIKPVSLQRMARRWGPHPIETGSPHRHDTRALATDATPTKRKSTDERLHCASLTVKEEWQQGTRDISSRKSPDAVVDHHRLKSVHQTSKLDDSAAFSGQLRTLKCKEEGEPVSPLKRKLPPGSRELFTLVAKQSRFNEARSRNPHLWAPCSLTSSPHMTRRGVRPRKAQA